MNAVPVFAAEQAIPSINVDVQLKKDGSAVITEVWDVRGVSDGTEYYKALYNMKGMSVHSLLVSDETGKQYKTLENWDTKRSREEKAGTCGILKTSQGYELCWGIGNYGDHQYTIQYTLEGLVKDYGDYAGFYHQFISELSSAPESISMKIRMSDTKLTQDNSRIWAYGFTGQVNIDPDGSLVAYSSEALGKNDYGNVLCRFDRGLFPMAKAGGMSFEKLQKSADNDKSDLAKTILFSILAAAAAVIIPSIFFYSRYKLADGTVMRLPGMKNIDINWTIPFGGSIPAVYSAMHLLRRGIPLDTLGAYLIRWQEAGYIHMEKGEDEGRKKTDKEEAIVFGQNKPHGTEAEISLYQILASQADENGILWISDIGKRSDEFYKKLTAWEKEVKLEGDNELIHLNAAAKDIKGSLRFTSSGFEQAVRILGLQKYLKDMSGQNQYQTSQGALWGDYLVFATLFHMGEQVLQSMKTLDPVYFNSFAGLYGCNSYSMIYLMTMTNHVSSAASPGANMDGTGGGVSSMGGGGFSGGGGGGSR
ncbi:DUF2207 domain-containing protein [Lacrimispora xylanisolvens]|uniref:DUF2207 domain-containing protein n=1 Tax=Lacrimispora xylanisolvens TaxID=384636 RepID=UPI002402CACF